MKQAIHTPLFLSQISSLLADRQAKKVIDATFAEGGHGLSLAKAGIDVLGIELDPEMYKTGQQNILNAQLKNVVLVEGNYRDVAQIAKKAQKTPVDAIIFDLGLSMYQLRHSQHGFSSEHNGELDLRIGGDFKLTAKEFINTAQKSELIAEMAGLLEDRYAEEIIDLIVTNRRFKPITSVNDLRGVIAKLGLTNQQTNRLLRKTLQALRIIVNDEFNSIERAFKEGLSILPKGGLLIFLTYHSLEDRLVKRLGREQENVVEQLQHPLKNKDYQFAQSGQLRIYVKK